MPKNRLEAFSDGVLAIIITIMVLELKTPKGASLEVLLPLMHILSGYVLSFVFVGIYWNNHHHLIAAMHRVNSKIMWANLHLLFWLSLIPFVTSWMGENQFSALPTAFYGFVLLMCGLAYKILQTTIVNSEPDKTHFKEALGSDIKGILSLTFYITAIICAFYYPVISYLIYVIVAIMWVVPDTRLEKIIHKKSL
jgi:uncharacterized membrane protein